MGRLRLAHRDETEKVLGVKAQSRLSIPNAKRIGSLAKIN